MATNTFVVPDDMSDLCRVCLQLPEESQYLDLTTIYDEEENLTYGECFMICTQIDLNAGEDVPHHLCKTCGLELQMSYDFHKKVEESKRVIEQYQIQIKAQTESTSKLVPIVEQSQNFNLETDKEGSIAQWTEDKYINVDDGEDEEQLPEPSEKQAFADIANVKDTSNMCEIEDEPSSRKINSSIMEPMNEETDDKIVTEDALEMEDYQNLEILEYEEKNKCSTENVKIKREILNEDEQLIEFKDEFKTASEVEHPVCAQDVIQIKKEPTNEYNENVNDKMAANQITNTLEAIQNTDEIKIENETINECVVASPDVFEIIEPALFTHLQPQSQDPVTSFSCEFCGHTLPTKNGIYKHCLRKHRNEKGLCAQSTPISLVCPICSKSFRTVTSLKTHINEKHSEKSFICEHCGHNLPTKNALCQHRLRKHRDIERLQINNTKLKFTCSSCAESFTTAKNLKLHKVRAHMHIKKKSITTEEKTSFQCEDCGHKLPTRNALYQHRLRKHRNKKNKKIYHYCAYCEIILPSNERLQSHLQASHGALPALKQLVDSL